MSKYDIPTLKTDCPSCTVKSVHSVIFENSAVRHFRCKACDAVHVCAMKGSFQSRLQPLPFAQLIELVTQDEIEAYSIHTAFHPFDVLNHPKFGTGYVCAILSPPQKMEVRFADKLRVLVCGPGSSMPEPVVAKPPEEEEPEELGEFVPEGTSSTAATESAGAVAASREVPAEPAE